MKGIWIIGFIFVLFTVNSLSAQTIQVIDSESNEVISGVRISYGSDTLFTDKNGQCDISPWPGHSVMVIFHNDYQPQLLRKARLQGNALRIPLIPNNIYINEITVKARRIQQHADHISQKLEKIICDSLSQQVFNAADLLSNETQVYVQKSQLGGGSPMLRGFSANSVLLVVDGIRMNNAIYRSGNLQNVINIDPLSIENVNVIYGPGSVLYGSDALGGVMAFNTLQPKFDSIRGSVFYRYGSAGKENTAHFDLNLGGEKWSYVSSLSGSKTNHLRMGRIGHPEYAFPFLVLPDEQGADVVLSNNTPLIQQPGAYEQYNILQKIRFKPNNGHEYMYTLNFSNTSDIPRTDRLLLLEDGLPKYAEWNYGPQTWFFQAFTINNYLNNWYKDELHLNIGHQYYRESRHERLLFDSMRRSREEQINVFSINVDIEKQLKHKLQLEYGTELTFNSAHSRGYSEDLTSHQKSEIAPRYPMSSIYGTAAVYACLNWQLNQNLVVEMGSRYNHVMLESTLDNRFYDLPYSEINMQDGALVGNAGMRYKTSDQTTFYASLSTGFRAPNIDDAAKVFDSEPGTVMVPNPSLEAEYSTNLELGLDWQIMKWFQLNASAFHTYLNNAMIREAFELNGESEMDYDGERLKIEALQNTGYAQLSGVQGSLIANISSNWRVQTQMTYMEGRDDQDSPLRHIPPGYGKTAVSYQGKTISLEAFAMYNLEKPFQEMAPSEINKPHIYASDSNGNPFAPAWYTLNVKGAWKISENIDFNLAIENILDKRYRPYASGIVAPGRNLIVSMRYGF